MRKISYKLKYFLLRRRKKIARRKHKKKIKTQLSRRIDLRTPEVLDLSTNFEESANFFSKIRDISNKKTSSFKINFRPLRKISASAALVFAAEMDRIKQIRGKGIKVLDFHKWDPSIRILLGSMGMYDLLNIINIDESSRNPELETEEQFMKFQTGDKAEGEDATRLRQIITNVIGTIIPESKHLQGGLTEAMTNVSHHAYPEDYLSENLFKKKQWWMSASFNNSTKRLTIIFYDQGIGIAKTLPKTFPEKFREAVTFSKDEGKMIQAAIQLGRSRTDESHRGKGLEEIKNYISNQNIENGYFRIYSGRGEFYYKKVGEMSSESTEHRVEKLQGTLIEWQICIKDKNKIYDSKNY